MTRYDALLDYIVIVIQLELDSRVIKEIMLSPEDVITAEAEILAMQSLLANSSKDIMNELMLSWEEATHYEEK